MSNGGDQAEDWEGPTVCRECGDYGWITVEICQAGDQVLTEEHRCPACNMDVAMESGGDAK